MPYSMDTSGVAVIVSLRDPLGTKEWASLIDQIDEAIASSQHSVVLDLQELESIDSSGLGSIVQVVSRCRLRGLTAVIARPQAFVRGVLEVTRLDQWIGVCESVDEAIRKVHDPVQPPG